MAEWKRNVYLLWIAVLIASSCWSMVMPFMPVFVEEELGVPQGAAWAGVLGSVNSLAMAVTAPFWGAVGDRFGRKLMMMRAGVVLVIAYAVMSIVQTPYGLLGVRTAIGMLTGFIPTAIALVGTTTPQESVGKALAIVSTAPPMGQIVGPMLGGLLTDLVGMRGTMRVGSVLIAVATLMVFLFVRERFTPQKRQQGSFLANVFEAFRYPAFGLLMVTTVLTTASIAAMEPILIPYIKELIGPGAPNWLAGTIYSLQGVAFVLAASWWTDRAKKVGYTTTVTIGLGLGALLVLPQAVAVSGWDFGALRLSQGLVMASVNPGVAALIAIVVPLSVRGRAFGINQSAFSVGAMIGPLIGGFLGTYAGYRWVFVATALILAGAALWTRYVLTPRALSVQVAQEEDATQA